MNKSIFGHPEGGLASKKTKDIFLIEIDKLKSHERISKRRMSEIKKDILKRKMIINPVVVERSTNIILDGHHRVAALRTFGAKFVPAMLVDYKSNQVKAYLRRKSLLSDLIKESVVRYVSNNKLFPKKTTKHIIKDRIKTVNVDINSLF